MGGAPGPTTGEGPRPPSCRRGSFPAGPAGAAEMAAAGGCRLLVPLWSYGSPGTFRPRCHALYGNRRPRSQVPARGASPFQAFSVRPDKLDSLAYLPEPGSGKGRVVSDRDDSPPLSTGLPCDWPLAVRTGLQRVCSGRAGAQRGGARHTPACARLALLSAPGLRLREAPDGLAAAVLFSRGWSGSQRPRGFSFSS